MGLEKCYLAIDLGASSGRVMRGWVQEGALQLEEVHRFANGPVSMGERLYWDVPYLLREMKEGLKKAARQCAKKGQSVACIGIDTWGVDYGYVAEDGSLLGLPFCYRDAKNQEAMQAWQADYARIYEIAGLQKIALNTAFQLYYDVTRRPEIWQAAKKLLFMPDLLAYFLTGEMGCEYTIASTSMLLDAKQKTWSEEILQMLCRAAGAEKAAPMAAKGKKLLPEVRLPGQVLGHLLPSVQEETGLGPVPVALVGSHDTASAVAGIPYSEQEGRQAFLSSGTWSLMGTELEAPMTKAAAYEADFTNEGGVLGQTLFLKNICGLWIVQQLRREWELDFPQLIAMAEKALAVPYCIDPEDERFTAPASMEAAVRSYCREAGQGEPESRGEILAAVYHGLTQTYRKCVQKMEQLTGCSIAAIHMVGGGIQDALLCQLTAQACEKVVVTGPVEAAAMGNIVLQMAALGEIASLTEGRMYIAKASALTYYRPEK